LERLKLKEKELLLRCHFLRVKRLNPLTPKGRVEGMNLLTSSGALDLNELLECEDNAILAAFYPEARPESLGPAIPWIKCFEIVNSIVVLLI
jgi:hypothetical protein